MPLGHLVVTSLFEALGHPSDVCVCVCECVRACACVCVRVGALSQYS